jgi:hypothetical protein
MRARRHAAASNRSQPTQGTTADKTRCPTRISEIWDKLLGFISLAVGPLPVSPPLLLATIGKAKAATAGCRACPSPTLPLQAP